MFHYRHNESYVIIEKSNEELTGDDVAFCNDDFDLEMYDVTIGFLSKDGEILRNTKKMRGVEVVVNRLSAITDHSAEVEIDIDFRLSMLELGL